MIRRLDYGTHPHDGVARFGPADLVVALLILGFFLMGLYGLDAVPKAHQDESWIAEPGYRFWRHGHFASELLRGFSGCERHDYQFMPIFPLVTGLFLRLFGMGLAQARWTSLLFATLTLLFTHLIARRLLGRRHGAVAVFILVCWPIAQSSEYMTTGIPMVDLARIARYDIPVPLFDLAALLVFVSLMRWRCFWAGVLIGCAMLSHIYGGAWLAVLLVSLWREARGAFARRAFELILGFVLALLPWVLFYLGSLDDYVGQNMYVSDRVQLASLSFYWENLQTEIQRYGPVVMAARHGRLSTLLWVAAVFAGMLSLWRKRKEDRRAAFLLTAVVVPALLFALLLRPRLYNYLVALWPFYALTAAAGIVGVLTSLRTRWTWLAAVLIFIAPALEGARVVKGFCAQVSASTRYTDLCARLSRPIPQDARILALQHYWFGLEWRVQAYRSFLTPIFATDSQYSRRPVGFAEAFRRDRPGYVLLDPSMLDFLARKNDPSEPYAGLARAIRSTLDAEGAVLIDAFEDPTYGRFEWYRVPETPGGRNVSVRARAVP